MTSRIRTIQFRNKTILLIRIDYAFNLLVNKSNNIVNCNNLLKQTLNKNVIYHYYTIIDQLPGTMYLKI